MLFRSLFMENKNLHTYITDPAEYEKTLSSLRNRLSEHGYHYDSATPIPPVAIPGIAKILMGIGTVLVALILLNLLFPKIPQKFSYALCGTGILAVACAYAVMPFQSLKWHEAKTKFGARLLPVEELLRSVGENLTPDKAETVLDLVE